MKVELSTTRRPHPAALFLAAALMALAVAPIQASAKSSKDAPVTITGPTPGPVMASTGCVGTESEILHRPSGPDIAWPFGPDVVASASSQVEIVAGPDGDIVRVTITDTSRNLPTLGEQSGPDAFAFNLPYAIDESNIRIISPSTFKRFRADTTPGGAEPFGRFDWEVRRDEHDATPFVFEIVVPGVDLALSDFGVNDHGLRFITRINGIYHDGENENRAFSACDSTPPPPTGPSDPLPLPPTL